MLAFPALCDALTASFGAALGADRAFDGPPARFAGSSGLAIGATREDVSSEFQAPPSGLDGASGEDVTVTCLAWSGDGSTEFKRHRDAVRDILAAAEARLAVDRTLGGAVDTAYLTGGTWLQEQTGEGALVSCEFRISARRF